MTKAHNPYALQGQGLLDIGANILDTPPMDASYATKPRALHRLFMAALFSFAFGLSPTLVQASVVVAIDDAQLAKGADVIVVGKVVHVAYERLENGWLVTRAAFQVYQNIKGSASGEVLTLQVPGGVAANGLITKVPGSPKLKVGQLWLGFLHYTPQGNLAPYGLSFGLLPVRPKLLPQEGKPSFRQYFVSRSTSGLALAGPGNPGGQPVTVERSRFVIASTPLPDFIIYVESLLHGPQQPNAPVTVPNDPARLGEGGGQ